MENLEKLLVGLTIAEAVVGEMIDEHGVDLKYEFDFIDLHQQLGNFIYELGQL